MLVAWGRATRVVGGVDSGQGLWAVGGANVRKREATESVGSASDGVGVVMKKWAGFTKELAASSICLS